jgi:two-component system sensor histidine kinase RpfC
MHDMLSIFHRLFERSAAIKNQELGQALVRLGLVVMVYIYIAIYLSIFNQDKASIMPFIWAVTIYFLYCFLLLVHIYIKPDFIFVRHYLTIILDMALLAVGMYTGGITAAFFYGAYIWIILGNGARFGQRSLYLSVIFAVLSFAVVIIITPFWQQNLILGFGLMIWLFLLPPYINKLITNKDKAIERAQMADNAKSRFLANMSHELRTPLTGILGYAQMIAEEDMDLEEARYAAVKVNKSANHLLTLINELLDIASIEAGKLKVEMSQVELLPLLQEVMNLVEVMAEKRHITFDLENTINCTVWADRLRLKQVLLNLLSNAIKYNRENGNVIVSMHAKDGRACIRVCDEGQGLNRDEQSIIFTPFERLSASPSSVEGAGIGLMISKNLIQAMAGEIGVESEKGSGSCFWIGLPVCEIK